MVWASNLVLVALLVAAVGGASVESMNWPQCIGSCFKVFKSCVGQCASNDVRCFQPCTDTLATCSCDCKKYLDSTRSLATSTLAKAALLGVHLPTSQSRSVEDINKKLHCYNGVLTNYESCSVTCTSSDCVTKCSKFASDSFCTCGTAPLQAGALVMVATLLTAKYFS